MRRSRYVLTSAIAAVGFSALTASAQQPQRGSASAAASAPADSAIDPAMAARPARYLLRNGQDYLSYREYDRALHFFRTIETRKGELTDAEQQQLRQGIARAQQGKREAVNGPHVVAQPKGRPTNPPGSFALAQAPQPKSARPAVAVAKRAMAPEPVQLTSGTMPAVEETSVAVATMAEPAPVSPPSAVVPSVESAPAPLDLPVAAAVPPTPTTADGMELPSIPSAPPQSLPDLGSTPPGGTPLPTSPDSAPASLPLDPAPASVPVADSSSPPELPATAAPTPAFDPAAVPAESTMPALPESVPAPVVEPAPAPAPAPEAAPEPAQIPASAPAPAPARVGDPATVPAQAQPAPDSPPVADAPPVAEAGPVGVDVDPPAAAAAPVGSVPNSESFLTDRHRREIEKIAQRNMDNPANDRAAVANPTGDPNAPSGLTQGSTRLELLRPPSPTEAQPIRRIPVPEEFVPLAPRDWNANRKYWAAAGTCHMILYFQDPVLERYGQGVEQALGPRGRFFSYPLDDPKQSNQRNQILQPFWSIGKFCFQVGTLPYKLVVDPPWEAEYDLGYYRPGDKIPPDTLMITPTGIGPPLKGRKY